MNAKPGTPDALADAIRAALTWPRDPRPGHEDDAPLNVIDGLFAISEALDRVADAIQELDPNFRKAVRGEGEPATVTEIR